MTPEPHLENVDSQWTLRGPIVRDCVSIVVEKDHLLYDCLKPQKSTRTHMRQVIDELLEQDCKDLLAKLGFPQSQ